MAGQLILGLGLTRVPTTLSPANMETRRGESVCNTRHLAELWLTCPKFAVGVSGGVMLYSAYCTESATQKVREKLERTGLQFGPRDMRTTRRIEYLEVGL